MIRQTYHFDLPLLAPDAAALRERMLRDICERILWRAQAIEGWLAAHGADPAQHAIARCWLDGAGEGVPPELVVLLPVELAETALTSGAILALAREYPSLRIEHPGPEEARS